MQFGSRRDIDGLDQTGRTQTRAPLRADGILLQPITTVGPVAPRLSHIDEFEIMSPYTTSVNPIGMGVESNRMNPVGDARFAASEFSTDTLYRANSMPTDKSAEVKSVEHIGFTQALLEEKPKKWTRSMFKLYFFLSVAFLNSVINGYDASIIGGLNTMNHFQQYFNVGTTGSQAGIMTASYAIGNIVGSFSCGPFTDWWGRRWGMFTGGATILVGACVQANSFSRAMFIGARFLLGFGVATCATAGPCYVAEMAHPAWRGALTGFYNAFWFAGAVPATWVTYTTTKIDTDRSWRLPIWFQTIASGTLCLGCLFIPETPRWLFSNNKADLAVRVLEKYHGCGNRKSAIVALTYKELVEEILISGSDKRWWDYRDLMTSWPRNACVLGMAFCSQLTGNAALTYYMSIQLKQVGIDDARTQLLYNAVVIAGSFVVALIGACFVDKIGRRKSLISATLVFVFCWAFITALTGVYGSKDNRNKNGSRAAIVFMNVFQLAYSFAYTPLQALYPVECLSYETRAKGMGMYNLAVNIALFFNTYGIPVIMGKLKWRFYIIYAGWNMCQVVFIYFFFVETKGRTLEEINEIFNDPNPRKRSLQKHKVLVDRGKGSIFYTGLAPYSEFPVNQPGQHVEEPLRSPMAVGRQLDDFFND